MVVSVAALEPGPFVNLRVDGITSGNGAIHGVIGGGEDVDVVVALTDRAGCQDFDVLGDAAVDLWQAARDDQLTWFVRHRQHPFCIIFFLKKLSKRSCQASLCLG